MWFGGRAFKILYVPYPRLLYISDVPIVNLYSGSAMMYRLLESYPKKSLTVYQGGQFADKLQLNGVGYFYHKPLLKSLSKTRLSILFNLINIFYNLKITTRVIERKLKAGEVQGIITVVDGLQWLHAYSVARRNNLPLVICIHDDIRSHYVLNTLVGKILFHYFKNTLKYSSARFCISEFMSLEYKREFNSDCLVTYPPQRKFTSKMTHRENSTRAISVAYAGTLEVFDYVQMLAQLAKVLDVSNSRLIIYGNTLPPLLQSFSNIDFEGFADPNEILEKLSEKADVLFLPFAFYDELNSTHLAFPSKIADYTLLSIPLLIWAPLKCSLGFWLERQPQVPGVWIHERDDQKKLVEGVEALLDYENRVIWGKLAFDVGKDSFSYEFTQRDFMQNLSNSIFSSHE